ncbi:MAG: NAD(P)-dependent oxidoreductase [Actinomycetota bacterium]|nr:NAD(P)-dependent oxidoreductase [Actinomycetota bacterium]
MGAPMARNLARATHDVTVWNRTVQKAEALEEDGAHVASTPVDAVRDAELVLTMLADARAVEETMIESGALDVMPQGTLWIQSSTIGVAATERLDEQAGERGITFVDAPVLGTKKPAEDGQLFMLASGREEARAPCEPVFDAVSRGHVWLGEAGLGTRLKLVVNSWILCTIENLSETFVLALRATFQQFDRAFELGHGDEDMSAVYYASAANAGARS